MESEKVEPLSREEMTPPNVNQLEQEAEEFRNLHIRNAYVLLYEGIKEILNSRKKL